MCEQKQKIGNKYNTISGWKNSLLASCAVDAELAKSTPSLPITHEQDSI